MVKIKDQKLSCPDNSLGCTMELQAQIWYKEHRFEEAKAEALCTTNVFERLGATNKVESCSVILQNIEEKRKKLVVSGELLKTVLHPTSVNSSSLAYDTG